MDIEFAKGTVSALVLGLTFAFALTFRLKPVLYGAISEEPLSLGIL